MVEKKLSSFAEYLIKIFSQGTRRQSEQGIMVNPIVAELASWYEKLRNAMDYRDDEVVLRAAIERILKRRILLGGKGKSVAPMLVRELIWARYFPDGSVPESIIQEVEKVIDAYILFKEHVKSQKILKEKEINTWMYHLMSAHIERVLNPHKEKDAMASFMFHVLKDNVKITDDSEQTRDIQLFIAIRRAYAKDDLAFLKYYLFQQYYEDISPEKIPSYASSFSQAYKEINKQLDYKLTHRIFNYVKKKTPPFFILEDILRTHKEHAGNLLKNEEELKKSVFEDCKARYASISTKVRTAIIRSVIFVLISKAFFALAIEGTYERLLYGGVLWGTMLLNVFIPPLLMIITSFFIRTPGQKNTDKIYQIIQELLFEEKPQVGFSLFLTVKPDKSRPYLTAIFTILWLATFILSFGLIVFLLNQLHFNLISKGVFLFFLAIVSFLTLRINRTAHSYSVEGKPSVISTVIDFFYLPIAQVGSYLTQGISQVNILLFILDFIIETPFKGLFAFFEQWLLFIHSKREYLE